MVRGRSGWPAQDMLVGTWRPLARRSAEARQLRIAPHRDHTARPTRRNSASDLGNGGTNLGGRVAARKVSRRLASAATQTKDTGRVRAPPRKANHSWCYRTDAAEASQILYARRSVSSLV